MCDDIRAYYDELGAGERLNTVVFPMGHVIDTADTEINLLFENL